MASRSKIAVFSSTSNAVAQFPAGAHAALAEALVVEATPRAQLLADLAAQVVLEVLLLALEGLGVAAVASAVALADEAEAVEGLEATEEVSSVDSAEVVVEEVAEGALDTSPTATVLPMALQLVPAVREAVALAATEVAEAATEATVLEDATMIGEVAAAVVATTEVPAVLTTNRSAAEIDTATVTVDMAEAETQVETKAHESAPTMATAMTIHEHDEDTRTPTDRRRLSCLSSLQRVCQKVYLPFSSSP